MKLKNKVAVVTGSSRGIGKAIALAFAKEGALVVVHYGRNPEAAKSTVQEIEAMGSRAFALRAELSSMAELEKFYSALDQELTKRVGSARFDILVNNAAIAEPSSIGETSEALFDRHMDINVKGTYFMTKQALSRLNDNGRIMNISTAGTRLGLPGFSAYLVSKGAIDVFTLTLAKELGKRNITVNTIAPGVTETDMANGALTPEVKQKFIADTLLGRIGVPDDIAEVALFLASDAGRWVTGQKIEASGGALL